MRLPLPSSVVSVLVATAALAGCTTKRPPAPPAAPPRAAPIAGAVGDTAAFPFGFIGIAYGPDRAAYVLPRPAYVTMIGVTETTIEPLMPLVHEEPRILMDGPHTTGLNRGRGSIPGAADPAPQSGEPSMAELQEYNRCLARGRALDKQRAEGNRRVIGRDSAGRPIYGPPEVRAGDVSYEAQCQYPRLLGERVTPATSPLATTKPGRYLLVFVSDTPVRHESIVALRISESDPRLFTTSIGRKLFDGRDAIWAGYFKPW